MPLFPERRNPPGKRSIASWRWKGRYHETIDIAVAFPAAVHGSHARCLGRGGSGHRERVLGYARPDQRRRQYRRVGLAGHPAAGLRGHTDDGADPGVPNHPFRPLDKTHHRRHEGPGRHKPHRRQKHLPVPVPVHSPGGHGGHGQHRGRSRRHPGGRPRRGILDVGHRLLRYDDQLLRKCTGHLLSPQEQRRRVVRRRHVLSARRSGQPQGAANGSARSWPRCSRCSASSPPSASAT